MKSLLRSAIAAAAIMTIAAGTASAQISTDQTVSLTVATTNNFAINGSPTLAPAAIAAGSTSSSASDSSATYSVSTNASGATGGDITAYVSAGTIPSGTTLLVEFRASGDNVSTQRFLNGSSSVSQVTVLTGLANESVVDQKVIYTFDVTAAAVAITATPVTVTYTFTPAA